MEQPARSGGRGKHQLKSPSIAGSLRSAFRKPSKSTRRGPPGVRTVAAASNRRCAERQGAASVACDGLLVSIMRESKLVRWPLPGPCPPVRARVIPPVEIAELGLRKELLLLLLLVVLLLVAFVVVVVFVVVVPVVAGGGGAEAEVEAVAEVAVAAVEVGKGENVAVAKGEESRDNRRKDCSASRSAPSKELW